MSSTKRPDSFIFQKTQQFNEQTMDAERWQKIKSLLDAVQELEPRKRGKILDNACAGDIELRREVERLIASFENAESFMEKPAAAIHKSL